MTTRSLSILISLVLAILFSTCKKEDNESAMYLSKDKIEFDYDENSTSIYISNIGSGEFSWDVSSTDDYIYFSKNSGVCSKNAPDNFEVYIQRNEISGDSISTSITISTTSGEKQVISMFILNFPENKIRLDYYVSDVEYDYINDRLIISPGNTGSDNFIEIYDLDENKFHRVATNNYSQNISISPDGNYAVADLGYSNQNISYINLTNLKLVDEFYISDDVNDIVLAPGKKAFIFPNYGYNKIGRLNLANSNYTTYQFDQIGDDLIAKLHPSGLYIYAAGDYSRLIKFDIGTGVPQMLYNSSSYDMDNKLWLSKDGTKIFTKNKKILHIDPTLPGEDVTDVTEIGLSQNYVYCVEQDSQLEGYYIIPTNNSYYSDYSESSKVLVYNNDFSYSETIYLEKFYFKENGQIGYTEVDASAEYVFSSSDGSKIIIVSLCTTYNYYNNWGIEIIEK